AGWGEALLSPKTAPAAAQRLFERARAGTLPLDDVLESGAGDSPVHAAAVEGAFRAVGLAAVSGTEPPADFAEALWDEALRLTFEPPGALPRPRIEHATLEPNETNAPNAWLLGRGAYFVAALALAEGLEAAEGRAHALLRPWRATSAPEGLSALLDVVRSSLEHPSVPGEHVGRVCELIGRLRSVVGPLGPGGAPHVLERATLVADETSLGVLTWPSLAALAGDRIARLGTRHLVISRRLERTFAEAVWQAHRDAGSPVDGAEALVSDELAPLVFASAPNDALAKLFAFLAERPDVATLVGDRLPALLASAPNDAPLALFRRIPERALESAVAFATRVQRDDVLVELWRRFPDALARSLHARLVRTDDASRTTLTALLRSAPASVMPELARSLDDIDALMKSSGETLAAIRELLHARIASRAPAWRDAYALFSELEERCRALGKMSSPPTSPSRRPPAE
ncbi:MAG TPA: hypothetical protein VMS65_15835, partial [Polyangiaceae bacterium]|nr:hypothetical protein [Polyangiaceae bacterium]